MRPNTGRMPASCLKTTNTAIRDFNFLDDSPNNYYAEKYNKNTDWKDKVYRTAFLQNYGINVEGGDEVAQYNLSLGYTGSTIHIGTE
mgnify:CR=1 FL=1